LIAGALTSATLFERSKIPSSKLIYTNTTAAAQPR
jgi:hypothetical protein